MEVKPLSEARILSVLSQHYKIYKIKMGSQIELTLLPVL